MPLPAMMADPDQMLGSPGMGQSDQQPQNAPVDPQEQARGAVQVVGKLRKDVTEQLSAVATQFPTVAKEAKELQSMIDQGIQRLVKKIISTIQTPEPQAPAAVR